MAEERPTIRMNEKQAVAYVVLAVFHDDPTNDPRKWDWKLVDYSGVTDRDVTARICGLWYRDQPPLGANAGPPMLFEPRRAAMRDTVGRLDRGSEALYYP